MPTDNPVILALERLATPPHAAHNARRATLEALAPRVEHVRRVHARVLAEFQDVARHAAGLAVVSSTVARLLRPTLLAAYHRLVASAGALVGAGDLRDLVDAWYLVHRDLDRSAPREFEART